MIFKPIRKKDLIGLNFSHNIAMNREELILIFIV